MTDPKQPLFPSPAFSMGHPSWPMNDADLELFSKKRSWLTLLALAAVAPVVVMSACGVAEDASTIFGVIFWVAALWAFGSRELVPALTELGRMPGSLAHELEQLMAQHAESRQFAQAIVMVRRLRIGDLVEARRLARKCLREEQQEVLARIEGQAPRDAASE